MREALHQQRAAVSKALGKQSLIYAGLRGTEIKSLLHIPQLAACVSMIAPTDAIDSISYERLTNERIDADHFHIDLASIEVRQQFRSALSKLAKPGARFVSYSPTQFLEDFALTSKGVVISGAPRRLQMLFENKPWVETQLSRLGVPIVSQRYYAAHVLRERSFDIDSSVVLRPSSSSGGEGLIKAHTAEDIMRYANNVGIESIVSISPYLEFAIPLNIGGVIWDDGTITTHPISVQLIGIEDCTDKPFGFCGNDYAAAQALPNSVLSETTAICKIVGRWMHTFGYRGAFGVDVLMHDGGVWFMEVNPRLQGSSEISSDLVEETGMPGIILEHTAAVLGLSTVEGKHHGQRECPAAQLIVHRTKAIDDLADIDVAGSVDLLADANVAVNQGAILRRFRFSSAITETGRTLVNGILDSSFDTVVKAG